MMFLFMLLMFAGGSAIAQDAGMSDTEIVGERVAADGEKLVLTPGDMEVRYIPRTSSVDAHGDSIALHAMDFPMQQAAQRPAEKNEKPAARKDDSILTFNFLYYIIQKYKLQDIID